MKSIDLIVFVAFDSEYALVRSLIRPSRPVPGNLKAREGMIGSMSARAVMTGIGPTRARAAVDETLRQIAPKRVLHVGVAGALDPKLSIGQLLVIEQVSDEFGGLINVEPWLFPSSALRAHSRTVSRPAMSTAEKAALRAQSSADVVDMESYVIASTCQDRGIPLAILRAVSDDAQETLLEPLVTCLGEDGRLNWPLAISRLIRRPLLLAAALRTRRNTTRALGSLRHAIVVGLTSVS